MQQLAFRFISLATLALMAVALSSALLSEEDASWPVGGQGLDDNRNQALERELTPQKVASLRTKWTFVTSGDVSATPTLGEEAVYVPDWGGNLYALHKGNGKPIWTHKISEYDGVSGAISRVSPAIDGNDLIIGDIENPGSAHNGANIIAVDRRTGSLRWITKVDKHLAAVITGSPVVFNGVVYVGVSSNEEGLADQPGYPCCTFRGSVVALNAKTGQILWKTYTMPDNGGQVGGYSGGAVWQQPAIDPARGTLYVGTGNNYSAPDSVLACQAQDPNANCTAPDDLFDTALALDLNTGSIKWARRLQGFDVWTVACIAPKAGVTCPSPASPDYDLGGSGPNLLPNMVGFGQKSGIYWALNPDDGSILWGTPVGPGGTLGGIEWGTATDGLRIYVAISNSAHKSYTLSPNGPTVNGGSWSALDPASGKILWQTADPKGATDPGAVSVANRVVYAGSYSGGMYALDAVSGRMLWSFDSGGSVLDGPSIVDGQVYWGSGYGRIAPGTHNNKVFAFSARD